MKRYVDVVAVVGGFAVVGFLLVQISQNWVDGSTHQRLPASQSEQIKAKDKSPQNEFKSDASFDQ